MPSGCPLPEAVSTELTVYRLISPGGPTAVDLATYFELGKTLRRPSTRLECCRHALSVQPTLQGVETLRGLFPRRYATAPVARLDVRREHGMIAPTPNKKNPEHHSFWPYEGTDRTALVTDIIEVVP